MTVSRASKGQVRGSRGVSPAQSATSRRRKRSSRPGRGVPAYSPGRRRKKKAKVAQSEVARTLAAPGSAREMATAWCRTERVKGGTRVGEGSALLQARNKEASR